MSGAIGEFFRRKTTRRIGKWLIVLAGIVAGQFLLYGPSLTGQKILLPLDFLAVKNVYLPGTPDTANFTPHDRMLADLVLQWEPARQFAISELSAGRLPMWNPYQYAGCPVSWPKFSPFLLLECSTRSPVILAWTQLLMALIAGFGAYAFFRRVLAVSFWAAAIPAWCYPITGFFIFWQGSPTGNAVYWLPWLLLALDGTIRRSHRFWPIGLSVITALVLVSGTLDVAGQVLLVSGLYAIWCVWDEYGFRAQAQKAILIVAGGWLLGFSLAAPYWLPLLEYAHTGARMERRSGGDEERPPVGLSALPQALLPDMYGTSRAGSLRLADQNQIESSAAGYTGILATLLVAPLAWCRRQQRSISIFFSLLILFGMSWCLDIPGLVALLRLPGLNMMSHNRLVFAASFAILAMTAMGLEAFLSGGIVRRWWFWLPAAAFVALFCFCLYRAVILPEPLGNQIEADLRNGVPWTGVQNLDQLHQIQTTFRHYYTEAAAACAMGIIGWLVLWQRQQWAAWAVAVPGFLLMVDLLWFAHDRSAQCDPALYYPRLPLLEEIAKSDPGRVVGFNCLPATLAETHGLHDIRGYDAIDPGRMVKIVMLAAHTNSESFNYSMTQWFTPRVGLALPNRARLPAVLDMLNVRYVIFRGQAVLGMTPKFQADDYWALVNTNALPRAFVPQQIETVTSDSEELAKLASSQFNPRAVAYVESPVSLPDPAEGEVEIVSETSTHVVLSAKMKTAGLIVLADLWDKDWKAFLNGQRTPLLRVNYAVCGVAVLAGDSTIEFSYAPASFALGLWLAGFALVVLAGAGVFLLLKPPLSSAGSNQTR